jgi:hypothetical protein
VQMMKGWWPFGVALRGETQANRATAQFISPDGRTARFDTVPAAGPFGSCGRCSSASI